MTLDFEPTMACPGKTAREIYNDVKANPARARFGFGEKLAIVNVDFQQAYTRPDLFPKTSYVTDPNQIQFVNQISTLARQKNMPVIWTHVAYKQDASDAGIWGTRTDTPDSLQNIKHDSERHKFDPRCDIHPGGSTSGCVRATAVDSLSHGYRTIVPEECVADKHESYHFANLTDLQLKYADVVNVQEIVDWLEAH